MTENERKREDSTEFTFINRNTGRKNTKEPFGGAVCPSQGGYPAEHRELTENESGEPESFFEESSRSELPFSSQKKKPLRGIGFVLAVQTVLALLLVIGAVAVRLIGGETAQKITAQYYQLTESGAVDLKSLFTPLESGTSVSSGTNASSGQESVSGAPSSAKENAQESAAASEGQTASPAADSAVTSTAVQSAGSEG